MRSNRFLRGTPDVPQCLDAGGLAFEPAEGIKQPTVRGRIHQRAIVVLAVDLDQQGAEAFQYLHAHQLVVDESAGAAVAQLRAPQNEHVLSGNVVGGKQRSRRMTGRDVEGRRDLTLFHALPHQAGVAARAQSQREGVQQDRFAGARLAGQHR
jgi:hypothetical protein